MENGEVAGGVVGLIATILGVVMRYGLPALKQAVANQIGAENEEKLQAVLAELSLQFGSKVTELAELQAEVAALRAEVSALKASENASNVRIEELERENVSLKIEVKELQGLVERLREANHTLRNQLVPIVAEAEDKGQL